MNKKGVIEHQVYFAMEVVLGILVAGIFLSVASNIDSVSNINSIYAKEDLKLLSETILASPGSVIYEYSLKSLYTVNMDKEKVTLTKSQENLIGGYTDYNLTFTKNQKDPSLQVKQHG